jgi:hypothetical protein
MVRLRESGAVAGASGAATIGAHVLQAAAGTLAAGRVLVDRWTGRLDELPFTAAGVPTARPDGIAVDRE